MKGPHTIRLIANNFTFRPVAIEVIVAEDNLIFQGSLSLSENEARIFNWFSKQQLPNGLLESVENVNIIYLYNNALAAMVVM